MWQSVYWKARKPSTEKLWLCTEHLPSFVQTFVALYWTLTILRPDICGLVLNTYHPSARHLWLCTEHWTRIVQTSVALYWTLNTHRSDILVVSWTHDIIYPYNCGCFFKFMTSIYSRTEFNNIFYGDLYFLQYLFSLLFVLWKFVLFGVIGIACNDFVHLLPKVVHERKYVCSYSAGAQRYYNVDTT